MHAVKKRFLALNQSNAATLGGGTAIVALIRLASSVTLSRLLAPEAFAIVLVLNSILFTFELMSDLGLNPFVIRDQEGADEKTQDTVWTIQVLRGAFLSAIMFIFAPGLALIFNMPDATNFIRVASVFPLFMGFISLGGPIATRSGDQRMNERVLVLRAIFTTTATIALAAWFRNAWAFALGIVLGGLINCLIDGLVFRHHWRLRFRFEKTTFLRIVHFSKFLFFSSLLTLAIAQTDKVVFAQNFPLEQIGLYGIAVSQVTVLTAMASRYLRQVSFPQIAKAVRENTLDRKAMETALGVAPLIFMFITGGAISGGPIFFQIVFDERYLYAGTFLSVLAAQTIFLSIAEATANTEVAFGNTRHALEMNALSIIWLACVIPPLVHWLGAIGVAAAMAGTQILPALVGMYRAYRRGLLTIRYYLRGALAVGAGVLTGIVGTWLIKVAAAAFSISL